MRTIKHLFAVMLVLTLAACASNPTPPDGAEAVRSKLVQLQSDPELAGRAPAAVRDAEQAVRAAEEPQRDAERARHLIFIADQMVEIARARAEVERLEAERDELREEREQAVRDARERELLILRERDRRAG